ncbi:MAG TPA: ATP-binding cassette domain-containing protein [Chitinophaga sp.]|uniref:ATP-binding cassette domain-containing protein n=1 Tax=Chitinophaga sp. TaxID=1869181 RepID=UPI002BDC1432|nr:ATP-binding cassette domain-containing protein [Chitinophaga sp.]HVI47131.1 ATP-binding cassette domain-containing protein [Chitinophaga sp.]
MLHELEADSIQKNFGARELITDCYIKCKTGEVIGILGRNGSGKSTLLKIIFGTEPAAHQHIRIDGQKYEHSYKQGNLVSYLPQHDFLPRYLSLRQIVDVFVDNEEKRELIYRDERLHIHLDKKTTALSGGELKYFEILLLVNQESPFILLDEPFSGVEPLYRDKVVKLISSHQSTKGFIITDHDYRNMIKASTTLMLLKDGICRKINDVIELEQLQYVPLGTFS